MSNIDTRTSHTRKKGITHATSRGTEQKKEKKKKKKTTEN